MRRFWAAWRWPIATFVVISAFIVTAMLVRGTVDAGATAAVPTPLDPPQRVNTREWRTIAADPAGGAGRRVVVWGQVTRFDPVADASSFRAKVDSARHTPQNGTVNYPTPVVAHGVPGELRNLKPGYIFTAEVTIDGPAAPGSPDAGTPQLRVTRLTITDKTVG